MLRQGVFSMQPLPLETYLIPVYESDFKIRRRLFNEVSQAVHLTKTEGRILWTLLRKKGKIVQKRWVSYDCYGTGKGVCSRSLDVHIANLRRKVLPLGIEIETVYGKGWALKRSESERENFGDMSPKRI